MIAADDYRRFKLTGANQVVHRLAELGPFAVAKPQDARRKPLKLNPLASEFQPPRQDLIVGEKLQRKVISLSNVLRIAGQRDPSKRPTSLTKKRPDVLGYETGNLKRVVLPCLLACARMLFP